MTYSDIPIELFPAGDQALATFDPNENIPAEIIWLGNFISIRTRTNYACAITDFTRALGIRNSAELYQVKTSHIIRYRQHLIARGVSPRTTAARLSTLSSLFRHLADAQLVPFNPVASVKRPRVPRGSVEAMYIEPARVRSMLDLSDTESLKGLRDRALLFTFFFTGCRLSEAVGLDVHDFENMTGATPQLTLTTKGGTELAVLVNDDLANALREYLTYAGHGDHPSAPLIQSTAHAGGRLTARQASRIFRHYALLAGLPPRVSAHAARTTFITRSLQSGVPIEHVQKSVGHADLATTQSYDKRTFSPQDSASRQIAY